MGAARSHEFEIFEFEIVDVLIAGFNFIRARSAIAGKLFALPGRDGFYEDGDRRTCERNRRRRSTTCGHHLFIAPRATPK